MNNLIESLESQLIKDMGKDKFARFAEASNHPHECKCDLCIEWWEEMGGEK